MPTNMPGNAAWERVSPIKLRRLKQTNVPIKAEAIAITDVPKIDTRVTGFVKKSIRFTSVLKFVSSLTLRPHREDEILFRTFLQGFAR